MAVYLFEDAELPAAFAFPEAFVELMSREEIPYYEPWWFLTKFPDEARAWLVMVREKFPARLLVPFAKYDIYAEIACFDGSDRSGNPVVHYVDFEASPGWESQGSAKDFADWLERTKQESAEWLMGQREEGEASQ